MENKTPNTKRKMRKNYEMHVISHTHWDREWRYPFQQFRMMLVDMLNFTLNLLEKQPDFKYFHLDSHTLLLEDYLELYPEMRPRLERQFRAGRLIIGPWYVLPDPPTVSGESLVRNLLRGMRVTEEFGGKGITGYSPFGFGQVSQTPQIYQGSHVKMDEARIIRLTADLFEFTEEKRICLGKPPVIYEIGTEETAGSSVTAEYFRESINKVLSELKKRKLPKPAFVVGKGTFWQVVEKR